MFEKQKKEAERNLKVVKAKIEEQLNGEGYKSDRVTIAYIPESQKKTIDLEAFKKAEREEYDFLLNDYPKNTMTSAHYSYKFKEAN